METDKFVTVLTFTFAQEVAIIRSRLESEGITCFVQDELTAQIAPFYSNAIGGVKLQVKESDLKQTLEILKEAGYIGEDNLQLPLESPSEENENPENQDETKIICPVCGSQEVVQTKERGWFFLLTSLLFMYPTPLYHRKYYCFNCKQEFKNNYKRKRKT